MKYVVVQTGGKQYKVSEGDILEIERVSTDKDKSFQLDKVLLYSDGGAAKVGMPFVSGVTVEAVVLEHVRGEKIKVAKFKAKARYRRITGHRQELSKVKIDKIFEGKAATKESVKPVKTDETVTTAEKSSKQKPK